MQMHYSHGIHRSRTIVAVFLFFFLSYSKTGFAFATGTGAVEPRPQFSKLQFDQWGRLFALGPDQKTLSRILVRDTGIATQKLFTRADRIQDFASTDSGFVVVADRKVILLDRGGKPQNGVVLDDARDLLDDPVAVAYSANHRFYVVDKGKDRVWVFGRNGVPLFSFGDSGERKDRLKNPYAVFVDRYENIYVLESKGKGQVEIYSHEGKWIKRLSAEALKLAPFSKDKSISPVVDQAGSVLALATDNKTFVRFDWHDNARENLDQLAATPTAIAFGNGQVAYENFSKIRLQSISSPKPISGTRPILPNVISLSSKAAKCDSASALPNGEYLCLDRKQGHLLKYAGDGSPTVRYGGKLDKPFLISNTKDTVAVSDRTGVLLFDLSGKLLSKVPVGGNIKAIDLSSDHLFLINNDQLEKLDLGENRSPDTGVSPEFSIGSGARFLAIDSLQNVYMADKNSDTVLINKIQSKFTEKIPLPDVKKILGLQIDGNNQLYVMAKHRHGGIYIHVYHGVEPQIVFRAGSKVEPAGFSISPGKDSLISVYDKDQSRFLRFQLQQVPSPIFQPQVTADNDKLSVSWLKSPEPFVAQYLVEATEDKNSPFVEVARTADTGIELRLAKKRYRYFRLRGISRSGVAGYPSAVTENVLETPFQLFNKNDFSNAANDFRALTQNQPWITNADQFLVRSLISAGQNERALDVLSQIQKSKGRSPVNTQLGAQALYNAGKFELANVGLGRLMASGSQGYEKYLLCAQIKKALNDVRAEQKCLKQLISAQPENTSARIMLLDSYDAVKNRKESKTQLDWLSRRANKSLDVELMRSLANYESGKQRYGEAIKWLERLLKIKPDDLKAKVKIIDETLKQGHINLARQLSLDLLKKPESRFSGYRLLGDIAITEHRPGEAVLSYRKAVELDPSNKIVLLSLAKTYRSLNNLSQASETLTKVLAVEASNIDAHLEMAQVFIQDRNSQAAIEELYKVLYYAPHNLVARKQLVDLLESNGQLQQATVQYIELNRDNRSEKNVAKLADLYFKRGRFRSALDQYKTLLVRHRNSLALNTQVGVIYHRLGENLLARKHLEKAVRLNRKSQTALVSLAAVYRDLHLYTQALRSANAAYKGKSSADNRLLIESIKTQAKDYREAKERPVSLRVDKFVVNEVYASSISAKSISIGTLYLSNQGSRDITEGSIRVYVGDFVDAGLNLPLPTVKAKSSIEVPLPINLSNHADEFSEDQVKTATIEIEYVGSEESRIVETSGLIHILGQHAVDWQSPASVDHFLAQPENKNVQFEQESSENKTPGLSVTHFIAPLVDAYSNIAGHTIDVRNAPEGEQRYVQYPMQTLSRHEGSYADLALLFASNILLGGHRAAITGTVENPVLLFDSGKNWDQRADLGLAEFTLYRFNENAWIPLAITKWKEGIGSMWQSGAEWAASAPKSISISMPGLNSSIQHSTQEERSLGQSASREWSQWFKTNQSYALQGFLLQNSGASANSTLLQQARWYAQHQFYFRALQTFDRVLRENPYSYDAAIEAGDVSVEIGRPAMALDYYQRAAILEPFDKSSRDKISKLGLAEEKTVIQNRVR